MNHDICKLQHQIENRLCADCNETLLRNENTFISLYPAVFICFKCYNIHKRVLPTDFTIYKSLADDWDERELQIMRRGGGNTERNKIWERYIPGSSIINKPVPDSNDRDREIWIKAKYFIKLFLVPQPRSSLDHFSSFTTIHEVVGNNIGNLIPTSPLDYLPTRLLDFYLVIGPGKFKSYEGSKFSTIFDPEKTYFNPCIFSSFPNADHYPDMVIPDLVSHMVFPAGITYSSKDHPPQIYSLVLTDINRVKIFCSVLLTYELVEPPQLNDIINMIGKQCQSQLSNDLSTIYTPKALVILSHYPFYHFFSSALKQLYHISLSSSPLPLERYIANLVNDVPLPPQGLTEVVFNLVDAVFQIRRPPPNQLPMVDFSYRPLFLLISTDNILSIFRCILNEYSLCFYSSNVALLTPIQEAFMTLLFPFVWQGVYIPILERSVIDIIDAPVPYIVGVVKDLLLSIPMTNRMDESNTVFVDIDNDRLSFEFDPPTSSSAGATHFAEGDDFSAKSSNPRLPKTPTGVATTDSSFTIGLNQRIPPLPSKATNKLREKLLQYGGVIYRSSISMDVLTQSSLAYPLNEHLVPLPNEAFLERGVAKKEFSVNLTANESKSKVPTKQAVNQRHPVICTLVSYFNIPLNETVRSIFDPRNNADYGDNFDAREIRGAFLRFFVACMQGYNVYIEEKSKASEKRLSLREGVVSSIPNIRVKSPTAGSVFSNETTTESFTKEDENFLNQLSKTQMFCNFESEKVSNPTQSELIFFDESIIEKQNRSLHVFSKKQTTPFLDDRRYEIRESYSCPGPSTWNIEHQRRYRYEQYPSMDLENIGPLQPQKVLVQYAEIQRVSSSNQSNDVLQRIHKKYRSSTRLHLERAVSSSNKLIDVDEYLISNYRRLLKIDYLIRNFQIKYRYWTKIKIKKRRLIAAIKLETNIRVYFAKKTLRQLQKLRKLDNQVKNIILCQSFLRSSLQVLRYQRTRRMIIRMQSYVRMRKLRKLFKQQRLMVVRLESNVRGYLRRIKEQTKLKMMMNQYCQQLLILWSWEHSPLFHRSACWSILKFRKISPIHLRIRYLDRALCEEELLRLYSSLDLYHHGTVRIKSTMTFMEKFLAVDRDDSLKQLVTPVGSKPLFQIKQARSIDNAMSSQAKEIITANIQREELERKALYLSLKQTAESTKDNFYQPFGLQREKKRKQTLSNSVWMQNNFSSMAEIDASAAIVTELHPVFQCAHLKYQVDINQITGIEMRRQIRIRNAVLEVAKSLLKSKTQPK